MRSHTINSHINYLKHPSWRILRASADPTNASAWAALTSAASRRVRGGKPPLLRPDSLAATRRSFLEARALRPQTRDPSRSSTDVPRCRAPPRADLPDPMRYSLRRRRRAAPNAIPHSPTRSILRAGVPNVGNGCVQTQDCHVGSRRKFAFARVRRLKYVRRERLARYIAFVKHHSSGR